MDFNSSFNEEAWATHLGQHFTKENLYVSSEPIIKEKFNFLVSIKSFGTLLKNDDDKLVPVYIVGIKDTKDTTRIKITRMLYDIIKNDVYLGSALFFILYENKNIYRFSYVKVSREVGHDGIISVKSDPKRYTYLLGEGIKTHTAETRLRESIFTSRENIETAFSVEPVNQEFYKGIYEYFNKVFDDINSDFKNDKKSKEFSLRFIGRIVFCWFLKEKDLIDKDFLSSSYLEKNETINYYDEMLSILFFEILNRDMNERTIKNSDIKKYADKIPFLNGGLFSKNDDDNIPNGIMKNETIKKLFKFLEMYNFTVDESTPVDIEISIDPEMLGRIFENLLADINPVTEISARKETGAFYTPREIVDYMVVSSLSEFFKRNMSLDDDTLNSMFNFIEELDEESEAFRKRESILQVIHKMKILDPACGSGAFPMGILQRIFMLINRLDPKHECYKKTLLDSMPDSYGRKKFEEYAKSEQFDYAYKMKILKDCIYGVDIQESAVEISRLRAFLSIIVDEKIDDTKDNRGIEPLPNLEFQFIIANSLIGLSKIKNEDMTFEDGFFNTMIESIEKISKKYFEASSDKDKIIVRNEFEVFRETVIRDTYIDDDLKNKLLSWKPFKNVSCDFFEPHIQFGIDKDTNFDIAIANPPYIQLQSMDKNITEKYINEKYKSYKKTGDIYQLFFEKSFNLLSPKGVASLITSNKWMRAGYGEFTRRFFMDNASVHKVLDLGSGRFESATVDTSIIFYGKKNGGSYNKERSINAINFKLSLDELQNTNIQENQSIKITSDAWVILGKTEARILEKMKKVGKPLKDWDISINYGIKTGFNEAFIIDTATKKALIKDDPKSKEIIKPLLRGRDIKRYSYEFADKWLINTHNGVKNKGIKKVDVKKYPAIKKHLDKYKKELEKRQDKGDTYYNLRSCAYLEDFEKPKIVWTPVNGIYSFTYIKDNYYFNNSVFMITHKDKNILKYLCAVLNVVTVKMGSLVTPLAEVGQYTYGSKEYIETIPIPISTPNQKEEKEITALVKTILDKKSKGGDSLKEEAKIDEIVYGMYGLSKNEINLIEGID